MTEAQHPALDLRAVTKRFGDLVANDGITLAVRPGEVVGILGENGAGKSTLMNILSGLLRPDGGEIFLAGRPADFASPREAISAGVGMVHQHFMLVPTLSVIENVALGDRSLRNFPFDLSTLRRRLADISARLNLGLDPGARTGALTVGEQQRVEIARVLARDPAILILDEPTAVLTADESARLFDAVRTLAAGGATVLLISHKLDDIFAVCDRVVVLRRGAKVLDAPVAETDRGAMVTAMVGASIAPPERGGRAQPGDTLLTVDGIDVLRDNRAVAVQNLSFDVRAGEILGVAGVEGNGQREVAEAVAGLRPVARGRIVYRGDAVDRRMTPRRLRDLGLRHVTENRHDTGVLLAQPLSENHLLGHLGRRLFNRCGWLRRRQAREATGAAIERFDVRAPHADAPMEALSGGNQQKMVLGRELEDGIRFLVAAHPTRGLDIRTIAAIQDRLLELRAEGIGILLISSDLGEIWRLADRVLVLAGGDSFGPADLEDTSLQEVGAWMAGHA